MLAFARRILRSQGIDGIYDVSLGESDEQSE
jgi:hypothetical protein